MNRFLYVALLGLLFSFPATPSVEARAFLVVGSTDELWPIDQNLTVDARNWIELAAQRQESTYPQTRGISLLDTSGAYIAPFFLEPDYNLSPGYMERGGSERTRIGERDKQFYRALDGDVDTFYFFAGVGYGNVHPTLDLGGIFPVNRILFYTHPERGEQYANLFTLFVNDGDPEKLDRNGIPIWDVVRKETENKDPLIDTIFPTRPVRYVSIRPESARSNTGTLLSPKPWEIAEFEVYGEGFVPNATYISEIIDISQIAPELPGDLASWGRLHWIAGKDEAARVEIRTRTGHDDDPNVYWWNTGRGGELSILKVDGDTLNFKSYNKVPNTQRGPITYDSENWSFWSPPYDLELGVQGMSIPSPGPRRYFQFRIDFFSTANAGSRIESIGFDFSKPPSARRAVAEIFPREVEVATKTTFKYFVRPTLGTGDQGFDSLEIETFVRPDSVHSVSVEGNALNLEEFPPEILEDRLVVHFPRFEAGDTQKLLEVEFDTRVVKFSTEFSSRIFNQEQDEVRQLVDAGDATHTYSGGGLSVKTPFKKQLISAARATPKIFTPNGDGVNDLVKISFAILNLTKKNKATIIIYDLSGSPLRRLRTPDGSLLSSGSYELIWDGRRDDDRLVPPGNYIYQVLLESDERKETQNGLISVAY